MEIFQRRVVFFRLIIGLFFLKMYLIMDTSIALQLFISVQRFRNKLIENFLAKRNLFLPCSRLIPGAAVGEGKLLSKIEVFFSVIKETSFVSICGVLSLSF